MERSFKLSDLHVCVCMCDALNYGCMHVQHAGWLLSLIPGNQKNVTMLPGNEAR